MPGVQRFPVAVAGILLDRSGRVLLIREAHGAREYGVPGGLVEDYDTPEATLEREFAAQTGVSIAIDHVVGIRHRSTTGQPFIVIFYRCHGVDGSPRGTGLRDIDEVAWFDVASLPTPMSSSVGPAIAAAAQGERGLVLRDDVKKPQRRRVLRANREG
jgi:8-oxo-dGTP pyrophosphatase MutT (NUDIX family)